MALTTLTYFLLIKQSLIAFTSCSALNKSIINRAFLTLCIQRPSALAALRMALNNPNRITTTNRQIRITSRSRCTRSNRCRVIISKASIISAIPYLIGITVQSALGPNLCITSSTAITIALIPPWPSALYT
jgi:hypothetical protein